MLKGQRVLFLHIRRSQSSERQVVDEPPRLFARDMKFTKVFTHANRFINQALNHVLDLYNQTFFWTKRFFAHKQIYWFSWGQKSTRLQMTMDAITEHRALLLGAVFLIYPTHFKSEHISVLNNTAIFGLNCIQS